MDDPSLTVKQNRHCHMANSRLLYGPKKTFFKPANIVRQLKLLRPIYSMTTNYGHFGKVDDLDTITWEKTDKVAALKRAIK